MRKPSAASRNRGALSLIFILAAVLGAVALLAVVISGLGVNLGGTTAAATARAPGGATSQDAPLPSAPTPGAQEGVNPPATPLAPATPIVAPTDTPLPTPTLIPTVTLALPPAEVAPTATEVAADVIIYTVQSGDSCWAIAQRLKVSVEAIIRQNNLSADCLIKPGEVLTINRQ